MTDSKKDAGSLKSRSGKKTGTAENDEMAGPEAQEAVEELDGEALIEKMENEKEDLNQKYLRLLAEFDNYKKRQSRIFSEMVSAAQDALILKMLDVLDNFERALESSEGPPDPDSIVEGVHLIYKQMLDLLSSENIEVICPNGECFDPNLHEAITALHGNVDEDIVTEVIQKGYRKGDRLVRPAKVIVTKPKTEKE